MNIKDIFKAAGIAGAGGAGFPAYAKQSPEADTFLVNGAECEPLLYTDYTILRLYLEEVASGAELVVEASGMKQALLCIETKNAKLLGLSEGQQIAPHTKVKCLPNVYPTGDEISLIYEATGRLVKPGKLPITAGVIVGNVESVYNMYQAAQFGKPVTHSFITIAGDVKTPLVMRVPVGTPIREICSQLGLAEQLQGKMVLDGGPAMGRVVDVAKDVVKKTTKGLTILPMQTEAAKSRLRSFASNQGLATTACCQCTRCTDLCPRFLLGYPLEPHRMVRTAVCPTPDPVLIQTATLCCGCGICETVACSQGISPRKVIEGFKAQLRTQNIKFTPSETDTYTPHFMRFARRVPASRMESLLGVAKFDTLPVWQEETFSPRYVEIALAGHIGAPSVPVVKEGDRVELGQMIASAGEGLSLPQHASITGRVSRITPHYIRIERE